MTASSLFSILLSVRPEHLAFFVSIIALPLLIASDYLYHQSKSRQQLGTDMPPKKTTTDGKESKAAKYTVTGQVRITKTPKKAAKGKAKVATPEVAVDGPTEETEVPVSPSKRVSKRKAAEATAGEATEGEAPKTRGNNGEEAVTEPVVAESAPAAPKSPKKSAAKTNKMTTAAEPKPLFTMKPKLDSERISLIASCYSGERSPSDWVLNKRERLAAFNAGEMTLLAYRGIKEKPTSMAVPIIRTPETHAIIKFYSTHNPAPCPRGRSLEDILNFSDSTLESDHHFIQHLFPLPEFSPNNTLAPLIDESVFKAFTTPDPRVRFGNELDIRGNLVRGLQLMANFYGFAIFSYSGIDAEVMGLATKDDLWNYLDANSQRDFPRGIPWEDSYFEGRTNALYKHDWVEFYPLPGQDGPHTKTWTNRLDHNQKRISRIIRTLRILGFPAAADGFWRAIKKVYNAQKPKVIALNTYRSWKNAAERPVYLAPNMKDSEEGTKWLQGVDDWELMPGHHLDTL